MPDIAMCKGGDCPKKLTCYRYRAVPHVHYQAYGNFHLDVKDGSPCGYYWELDVGSTTIAPLEKSVVRSDKELSEALGEAEARIQRLEEVAKESSILLEDFLHHGEPDDADAVMWETLPT